MHFNIRTRNDRDNWKRRIEEMNYLPELRDLLPITVAARSEA
jgi:hypothetical protein